MARTNKRTILAPVNGLALGAPGTLLDPRSTPSCLNVEIRRALIRTIRGGIAMGDELGERVLGIGELERGGLHYLVRVGPTKAETWAAGAWTNIIEEVGVIPAPDLLAGDNNSFVDFAYPMLTGEPVMAYTNGVDPIRVWTGTGLDDDLAGSPPISKFLLNYKGYLLLGYVTEGTDVFRARVRWCDAGDPEEWSAGDASFQDLLEDDLALTAMALFGEYIAVHKSKAIYLGYLTGNDFVFRFDRKEVGSGCVAPNALVNIPTGEQVYLSKEGIRLFNGITAPLIESSVNEDLAESMNVENIGRSWAVLLRELQEVWFGIPIGSDTDPDTIIKYNYLTRQVFKDKPTDRGITVGGLFRKIGDDSWDSDPEPWDSDLAPWDHSSALALHQRVLWGVGADGDTIERTDSANFDEAAISSEWESKDFTAADFELEEVEGAVLEWQGVEVIARGSSVNVQYSIDGGSSWRTGATLTLESDYPADNDPPMVYFIDYASKCRFRFSKSALSGSFELKQFRPHAVLREARR